MRGAGFALLDGRDDTAKGRMHQPPQRDDSDAEHDENEIVERHIAGGSNDANPSSAGSRAIFNNPSSPPVTLCDLIASDQNIWPNAIVMKA